MSFVCALKLFNFRCYEQAGIQALSKGLIALHGPNGAGKTNILEALSLLSPGRGLRGAGASEIQNQSAQAPWAVAATLQTAYGNLQIGTGLAPVSDNRTDKRPDKRIVRINGENAKNQGALTEHIACVWLTPQMDRLFCEAASHRRRFFDRLVFAFDPGHAGRVLRYENALRQRAKLLQESKTEDIWIAGLEKQMAQTGVAIAAARREFAQRLQMACEMSRNSHFPLARLRIMGTIEDFLARMSALEVEELFRSQLAQSRSADAVRGGAATGPHKSDLYVVFHEKDMAADQCSTGEQKALLIGILLAHARLMRAERGSAPMLLFDEVSAHLDEGRRAALYDILTDLGGQVWMSGTDASLFDAVRHRAQFFEVRAAQIM